jgi:hypothetical protein
MHMFLRSIVFKCLPVQKNYITEKPSQIGDRIDTVPQAGINIWILKKLPDRSM